MTQFQTLTTELNTQQADADKLSLVPMMLLDDEALKHVAGGGPCGGWSAAVAATAGPVGG